MKRRFSTSPLARLDLLLAIEYLNENATESTGERFLQCAENTFQRLASHPELGHRCHFDSQQLHGLRQHPISAPFGKYLVFYRLTGRHVEIVRVLHGARDLDAILSPEDAPQ